MTDCGSRPCPLCSRNGTPTGTDGGGVAPCRACRGTGWYPYPWEYQAGEDLQAPERRRIWTVEESAIVTSAPTLALAWIGYVSVYGESRSRAAIREHRRRTAHSPFARLPRWSDRADDLLDQAVTASEAVELVRQRLPELAVSDAAIAMRYSRLHAERTGTA